MITLPDVKFVRFIWQQEESLGILHKSGQFVLSLNAVGRITGRRFPFQDIESYIQARLSWESWVEWVFHRYQDRGEFEELQVPYAVVNVLSPVRRPVSLETGMLSVSM